MNLHNVLILTNEDNYFISNLTPKIASKLLQYNGNIPKHSKIYEHPVEDDEIPEGINYIFEIDGNEVTITHHIVDDKYSSSLTPTMWDLIDSHKSDLITNIIDTLTLYMFYMCHNKQSHAKMMKNHIKVVNEFKSWKMVSRNIDHLYNMIKDDMTSTTDLIKMSEIITKFKEKVLLLIQYEP